MDLTQAISGIKTAQTMGEIQVRVARKILDMQEQSGQAALQLLQAASNGAMRAGDELTAAATGLGGAVDVYA